MSNEKIYIYRIVTGIVLWFSNNEFTWEIINYFANISNNLNVKLITFFSTVIIFTSLLGLIITFASAIQLFKLTLKRNWN